MNRIVQWLAGGVLFISFIATVHGNTNEPPGSFTLLEPPNGTHLIFTDPLEIFSFQWEDVLELDTGGNNSNTNRFYNFRIGFDPDLTISFGDDGLKESQMEFIAGGAGVVFKFFELLTGILPDTANLYWTIEAVNEEGNTWASDTFHVRVSVDNEPPLSDFSLLAPQDGSIIDVQVDESTLMPLEGTITFTWEDATDPDDELLFYFWVISDMLPIPDVTDLFLSLNGADKIITDNGSLIAVFPSGRFEDLDDKDPEFGGNDTFMTIPYEVAYYWFFDHEIEEKEFYWTVIASDGFRFIHWVPSDDTLSVTFRKSFISNVNQPVTGIPTEYFLFQNYPNPFNPSTTIRFSLPERSIVTLGIYNILGQRINTLIDGKEYDAGYYDLIWDAKDQTGKYVTSGTYIYRIQTENFTQFNKMIFLR